MSSPLEKLRDGINKSCPAFVDSFYDRSRYKIEYGGAGSGKSHAIAKRLNDAADSIDNITP